MSWLVQEYDGVVHVVPDTDPMPHVLDWECWCGPSIDTRTEPRVTSVMLHRDELDRLGLEAA